MPDSLATASPVARYWLPAMSRKKSRLALRARREQRRALPRQAAGTPRSSASPTAAVASPNFAVARLRWQVASRSASCSRYCSERKSRSSWPRKPSSAPFSAPGAAERLAEQVEAAVDQRLLLGDRRRGVVVRARVGDAAAEDVLVLVDDHRLGGRRAEVDADEAAHEGFLSERRVPVGGARASA